MTQRTRMDEGWAAALSQSLGTPLDVTGIRNIHGGSIHRALRVPARDGAVFVKVAAAGAYDTFVAEAEGLDALRAVRAVRVPAVLAVVATPTHACLALEWLELQSPDAAGEARFGEQLAVQHRASAERFGWHRANTLGATPQPNDWSVDWLAFFRERRLRHQLALAAQRGASAALVDRGAQLCARLSAWFAEHAPSPSLLHGDLWGGNWSATAGGEPVIFDPAVYYGDREADIAMTRLFGGFGPAFYRAYERVWPLPPGAGARVELYNLYHVLNHYNLFGGSYERQALGMIERLLAHAPSA